MRRSIAGGRAISIFISIKAISFDTCLNVTKVVDIVFTSAKTETFLAFSLFMVSVTKNSLFLIILYDKDLVMSLNFLFKSTPKLKNKI